jgi:hypothetical protein
VVSQDHVRVRTIRSVRLGRGFADPDGIELMVDSGSPAFGIELIRCGKRLPNIEVQEDQDVGET